MAGPFARAVRTHPRRGQPSGWGDLRAVAWNPQGRFHADDLDPGDFLDYHTGTVHPQDAASQVPAVLLAAQPGETIVDVCAAPGSKSTQIGLDLGDDGLLICCDASAPRRRVLAEVCARQGITCAVITPMGIEALVERHPGSADGVLVDAPCSGHEPRSDKQVARMSDRQVALLASSAPLVRPGGRLVYSTCTPHVAENEEVIERFLAAHPRWSVDPRTLSGCDTDLAGLGAIRLWPQRQGTEPFFACRLLHAGDEPAVTPVGYLPPGDGLLGRWLPGSELHCWRRGTAVFMGSAAAAACPIPSEARGTLLGHARGDHLDPEAWAAQALIERGATSIAVERVDAAGLWAGDAVPGLPIGSFIRTGDGAPLGLMARDGRLALPSRMRRAGLRY